MKKDMKIPRIVNSVGHIDDELIISSENSRKKNTAWIKWSCIVAAVVMLIISGTVLVSRMFKDDTVKQNDRYKDFYVATDEIGIIWPWEYMTVYEKYSSIDVNGVKFHNRRREISSEYIGELIGVYEAEGYEEISDGIHHQDFEVYTIQDISAELLIAVKMEDKYYVFISENYESPETFGVVLKSYDLADSVILDRFSLEKNGEDDKYYVLTDDAYIWEIFDKCADAPKADALGWHETERTYLSFTVTSEAIGVYKNVLYVTDDGYVWTNIFESEYLYYIGVDNADKIIQYAKENSSEAEFEPYRNTVVGEVVEITEKYLLIDDSVLCKNPSEGITYKILINDISISRYVDNDVIKKNQIIQVTYEGEMNNNSVNTAISIDKVIIAGEDIVVPE